MLHNTADKKGKTPIRGAAAELCNGNGRASLVSLPPEIIELVALHCATGSPLAHSSHLDTDPVMQRERHATPPSGLRNLLLTSRRMYSLLNSSHNTNLYARIFRSKFDVESIARRFGPAALSGRRLTRELQKRCICLKRIRRAVTVGRLFPEGRGEQSWKDMEENLWLAYMMMLENDGLNLLQLQWAGIEAYLSLHHSQEMLQSALKPEYPQDTSDRALALHLYCLLSDPDKLTTESRDESDEKLFVLRPFVFAAHRFDAFYAPWTARNLPMVSAATSQDEAEEVYRNLFLADLRLRSRCEAIEHCGQKLQICVPNLTHAACFAFFMKVEKDPAVTGLNELPDPLDIAETMLGRRRGSEMEEHLTSRNPLLFQSKDHDGDLQRLLSCVSPQQSPGLKTPFHLGSLEGSWEGRFTYFDFDSYRDMLGGKLRSLYAGRFGEQPQVWKLKEHIVRLGQGEAPGGKGDTLNSGYYPDQDEPTDREHLSLSEARGELARKGSAPPDLHLYPTFGAEQLGAQERVNEEEEEEGYEILLSGTGHSAWGRFILRGRIRSWDGMFTMTKEYRPDGRGRWLYRGYVVAGGRMVGRWRDTFTPEEMSGYEGCFLLHRRGE